MSVENAYLTLSKNDPFNTWLIVDSAKTASGICKKINSPILSDSITTLKRFAKTIVAKTHPEYRIINSEEQFIVFSKIASKSGFAENGKRPSATLINQLIYIYTTEKTAQIKIPNKSAKHEKIIKIIETYEKWCIENNVCDSFSVIEKAITAVKNGEFKINNLITYNIRSPNKLSFDFIDTITKAAENPFPHSEDYQSDIPDVLKKENIVRYKDSKTEIKSVLEKICRFIESGTDPKKILVLTPSISKTVKLIDESVTDFYYRKDGKIKTLNYSCSEHGTSLANTPIVKSALSYLSAVTRNFKTEDLEEILLSPFFTNSPVKITAGDIREISIVSGVDSKKTDWLNLSKKLTNSKRLSSKIADVTILIDWLGLPEHKNTLSGHCSALKEWLKNSGWTDYVLSKAENSARAKFLRLIDSMQNSVSSNDITDLAVFYSYLLRFSLAKFVTENEKEDSFSVSKISSAASLKADHVFIVGLSSNNIPNIPQTLPPFSVKETEEILPLLRQDMFDTEDFHFRTALFSAEKELYLSCAGKDNRKNLTTSSFMTRLFNSEPLDEKITLEHSIFANQKKAGQRLFRNESCEGLIGLTNPESVSKRLNRELQNSYCTDFSNTDAAVSFEKYNENYEFAPTTLEKYRECPFKWYLNNHLKLYSAEEQGSEAILIGIVVHKILQRFFTEFKDSVKEDERKEALDKIMAIASEEFDKIKISTPDWNAKRNWYLGEAGLPCVFEKFIENEIKLSKDGWTTPRGFIEKDINSEVTSGGRKMRIIGKIDRVLVNENSFQIMDYKTGTNFSYSAKNDEDHFQIPLYADALSNSSGMESEGGMYLKISTKVLKEIPVFDKSRMDEKTGTILLICFDISEAMKKGVCSVTNKCKNTAYCPFKTLCRHKLMEDSE